MAYKKIRVVQVKFTAEIKPWEIDAFRAAVAETAGFEHDVFHNHDGQKLIYRYPLVQYKMANQKAAILFLERAVDEAYHFFTKN